MNNQAPQITDDRALSQSEIDLINEIKAHAEETRDLVGRVIQFAKVDAEIAKPLSLNAESLRWASIARTHLQQGYMALTRVVAKTITF